MMVHNIVFRQCFVSTHESSLSFVSNQTIYGPFLLYNGEYGTNVRKQKKKRKQSTLSDNEQTKVSFAQTRHVYCSISMKINFLYIIVTD